MILSTLFTLDVISSVQTSFFEKCKHQDGLLLIYVKNQRWQSYRISYCNTLRTQTSQIMVSHRSIYRVVGGNVTFVYFVYVLTDFLKLWRNGANRVFSFFTVCCIICFFIYIFSPKKYNSPEYPTYVTLGTARSIVYPRLARWWVGSIGDAQYKIHHG